MNPSSQEPTRESSRSLSERERSEERIRLEVNLLGLLEFLSDAIVIINSDGRILLVNSQAEKMFGYHRDELLRKPVEILLPERFREAHVGHRAEYLSDHRIRPMGVGLNLSGRRKDGSEFPVEISLSPMETKEGLLITSVIRDITDRKRLEEALRIVHEKLEKRVEERTAELVRALEVLEQNIPKRKRVEEALRESEERFKAFMNNSVVVAWMKDEQGEYVYVNQAFERSFNIMLDDLRGKTDFDLWPAEVAKQLHENDMAILASDKGTELYETVPTPDGSPHDWMAFKFPFRDTSGKRFVGGMAFDITEKVELERQVRQAEKLAAVGQLTTGLAHEIGTPLNVIMGRAEYMLRKMSPEDPLRENLERIIDQIERITKLVQQLLGFARPKPLRVRSMHLAPIIKEMLGLFGHQIVQQGITTALQWSDDLPEVMADADQIQQVLFNITLNAVQAMPRGGSLTIRANRTIRRQQREDPLKDQYLKVEIADTGPGIPADQVQKIFDPFFSTKDVGKGSGLGLTVSYSIMKEHGGWIDVKSRVGEGSVFGLYFPLNPKLKTQRVQSGEKVHG